MGAKMPPSPSTFRVKCNVWHCKWFFFLFLCNFFFKHSQFASEFFSIHLKVAMGRYIQVQQIRAQILQKKKKKSFDQDCNLIENIITQRIALPCSTVLICVWWNIPTLYQIYEYFLLSLCLTATAAAAMGTRQLLRALFTSIILTDPGLNSNLFISHKLIQCMQEPIGFCFIKLVKVNHQQAWMVIIVFV